MHPAAISGGSLSAGQSLSTDVGSVRSCLTSMAALPSLSCTASSTSKILLAASIEGSNGFSASSGVRYCRGGVGNVCVCLQAANHAPSSESQADLATDQLDRGPPSGLAHPQSKTLAH